MRPNPQRRLYPITQPWIVAVCALTVATQACAAPEGTEKNAGPPLDNVVVLGIPVMSRTDEAQVGAKNVASRVNEALRYVSDAASTRLEKLQNKSDPELVKWFRNNALEGKLALPIGREVIPVGRGTLPENWYELDRQNFKGAEDLPRRDQPFLVPFDLFTERVGKRSEKRRTRGSRAGVRFTWTGERELTDDEKEQIAEEVKTLEELYFLSKLREALAINSIGIVLTDAFESLRDSSHETFTNYHLGYLGDISAFDDKNSLLGSKITPHGIGSKAHDLLVAVSYRPFFTGDYHQSWIRFVLSTCLLYQLGATWDTTWEADFYGVSRKQDTSFAFELAVNLALATLDEETEAGYGHWVTKHLGTYYDTPADDGELANGWWMNERRWFFRSGYSD